MLLDKIVSGGQTGVDQAALKTAARFGLRTGGYIPKGYITLEGPRVDLGRLYGLIEDKSDTYPPRTYRNVKESDGTLRIFENSLTDGERCTYNAIRYYGRPFFDVDLRKTHFLEAIDEWMPLLVKWVNQSQIFVLNVAGHSEQTCPKIGERAELILSRLFQELGLKALDE